MKIAVSTDDNYVSAHFGRCSSFTIINMEKGKVVQQDVIENPGHQPGLIPKFLHEKGVECIVTGGMGMRASSFFQEYGIKTVLGIHSPIVDVIEKIRNGTLKSGKSLCHPGGGKGYGLDKTVCDHPQEEDCGHEGGKK